MLTSEELNIIVPLAILLIGIPVINFIKKDPLAFWSPITLICLVFIYYTLSGPLLSISNENTVYRLTEHRPYFLSAWRAALVAFISLLIGFNLVPSSSGRWRSIPPVSVNKLTLYGRNLFLVGFIFLLAVAGFGGISGQITFWDGRWTGMQGYQGAFQNYMIYGVNFFIPSICLILLAYLKDKKVALLLGLTLFVATGSFLNAGFRYRLVILGYGLFASFYIYRLKKPNPIILVSAIMLGLITMGIIQATRTYGSGLRLENLEGKQEDELFITGFDESAVFMTTGLLLDQVPHNIDHIGWDPLVQALVFPIPRQLWPQKPSGEYLDVLLDIYGGGLLGTGAAVLYFGEYYLGWGWWGVIIGSLILGLIAKKLWIWFRRNYRHPLAIAFYAVFNAYFYVIISRGYLPQVVFLFVYTVMPAYVIIWYHRRKNKGRWLPSAQEQNEVKKESKAVPLM